MVSQIHIPVLLKEIMEALVVQPGGRYIDCTLGGGGHATTILEQSSPGGQLLGIDASPEAIAATKDRLSAHKNDMLLVNDNFTNLEAICLRYDFLPVHGILFDLGLSSMQLGEHGRGFSFQYDAPLDMRFNPEQGITASDIINTYSEVDLARLIRTYGEEGNSNRIASQIVQDRPLRTTLELAGTIEKALDGKRGKLHPATKTFQALRVVVNRELENLEKALKQAVNLLGCEGRLAVISYHSLEDRIVKRFMQQETKKCICPPGLPTCLCGHRASLKLINRRVITPSPEEIKQNPRSRSAKLRIAERVISPEGYYPAREDYPFPAQFNVEGWRRPALLKKLRVVYSML
ncbi:16S rRNA (cytosine(1402)-N(4))-methyltransferase RsmH [Chloroflexota bacterium]